MKATVNTEFLPKGGAKAFAPSGREKTVQSIVPAGEDEEEFVAECAQRFAAVSCIDSLMVYAKFYNVLQVSNLPLDEGRRGRNL